MGDLSRHRTRRRGTLGIGFAVIMAGASLLSGYIVSAAPATTILDVPAQSELGGATAITLKLPGNVAAVEGRLLLDRSVAELVGVAPRGGGTAFMPVVVPGGYAFGAHGLIGRNGATELRLVIAGYTQGRLNTRVLVDAASDASGHRIDIGRPSLQGQMRVGIGTRAIAAPDGVTRPVPARAAQPVRDLFPDGVVSPDDLDSFRAAWYRSHEMGTSCTPGEDAKADANGDGCIDITDIQLLTASQGTVIGPPSSRPLFIASDTATRAVASAIGLPRPDAQALDAPHTFVVTSTADTNDAIQGDGLCSDSLSRCTLRAAIMEANWQSGQQRIEFDLAGAAPVAIPLTSHLPNIGSASAQVYLDGYSQPGSQPNTAQYGTNAIPGVELRGQGIESTRWAFYVARPGNTIRGFLMNNGFRGVFVDGPNASDNVVIGNWMGFNRDNSLFSPRGIAGIQVNGGAKQNRVGTPALADRNVIGNYDKAVWFSGSGTDRNVVQNNVLCIRPNGQVALCHTGIDHDFGPKDGLVGGTGPNELNVIGATCCNAVELSHGWDPSLSSSTGGTPPWWITGNRIVGNWLGFRPDGHYDPAFRSALSVPAQDNGQAINIYDGASSNVAEGNYVASAYDGFTIAMGNASHNIVRNNIFGESPWGEAAPMAGWGGYFRLNTKEHLVEGNIIRNSALGGVGLIESNVRNITISRNIITGTNGPAIYLAPEPGNPGFGANGLMSAPEFTASTETVVSGTGISGSTVEVFRASRGLGAYGLPLEYLGSAFVSAGTWSLTYAQALQTGQRVTALQTRGNGETSELAANVYAGGPPPPPTANFTWSQGAGTLRVDFTDTSSASPTAWSWNFGDGSTSTQPNPSRTYGAAGTYTVTLTAVNDSGSNVRTQSVTVSPIPPGFVHVSDAFGRSVTDGWGAADVGGTYAMDGPASAFNVGSGTGNMVPTSAGNSRGVFLDGVSLRDVNLRVRVASNKAATGSGTQYVYLVARHNGTSAYRPKIIISSNGQVAVHSGVMINGNESSMGNSVTVPGLAHAPNAFIWLRAEVTGANPTTVRVKAWSDGQSEPANWQFTATNSASAAQGSGGVGLSTYISSGITNAPVTFRFDDLSAATPGTSAAPPPVAGFTFSQVPNTLSVNFTDTSTNAPTSWVWNFGDGTSSTLRNPSKTFAASGNYSVTLTATNSGGSNAFTQTVNVSPLPPPPAPVADFEFSQVSNSLTVDFTDTSLNAPSTWSWSFGDGTTSTQRNPIKAYALAGTYNVSLTAINGGGSNSITKSVTVVPLPPPTFITYAADVFNRTVSNGWGTATSGGSYTLGGTSTNFGVSGGVGSITVPTAGQTRSALLNSVSARDVDITFRVRANKVAAVGAYFLYAVARRNGATDSEYRPRLMLNANGTISAHASVLLNGTESSLGNAVVVPGLNQTANSWIWLRAQVTGTSPTTVRVKAWAEGQAEPAGWNFTATNSAAALQGPGSLGVGCYVARSVTNAPVIISYDDYLAASMP